MNPLYQAMLDKCEELLPKDYELEYIDYRDNIDQRPDLIQSCIYEESPWPLNEEFDEWYRVQQNDCISQQKSCILEKLEQFYYKSVVEYFALKYSDEIDNIIYQQSSIAPRIKLLDNSRMCGRIEIQEPDKNSHLQVGELKAGEFGYLLSIIDILHINPRRIYDAFPQAFGQYEPWADLPQRDGHEKVEVQDFIEMLRDLGDTYYTRLTFLGQLPLGEMFEKGFNPHLPIVIPAGTFLCLYDSGYGYGTIDIETTSPITLDYNKQNFDIVVDSYKERGYGIVDTYGLVTPSKYLFEYEKN